MSRDRDDILEGALKHELRQATPPEGEGCLDAETLAAWEDGGLDATTMAAVDTHVSNCSRCRALVAVTARALPPLIMQPGTSASKPEGALAFWKWLVPIAAGAAAVTLWMVVPGQQQIAVAPPQPPAPMTAPAPPQTPAAGAPQESPASLADSEAKNAPQTRNRLEARQGTVTSESTDRSGAAAPAAAKEVESPAALAESVSPAAPSPAPPAPAIGGLQRRKAAFAPLQVVSPAPAQQWRVTEAGIERSQDTGATWSLVRPDTGETITAGASPAPNVCWFIGNDGVALLTTNGSVFTRIDIPGAGNLRTISPSDARSATVVNAAGRTFRTDDGGRTWR